jgi:alcohol dehydrogenase
MTSTGEANCRRSLLLHAPHQLVWETETLPPLGPRDLLVRTRAGAISIGTELPLYCGMSRSAYLPVYPLMTGYESLAEVLACGDQVRNVAVGDRVIATYGHRSAAVVPEARAIPVPADIPDQLALLLILACDTAKGVAKIAPQPADQVLISGAGTIGLLTLFNLRAHGIGAVDLLEPQATRRTLALDLGARAAFDPAGAQPPTAAYQAGFECSSRNTAFAALQDALVREGRICILADGNLEPLALTPAFHAKELAVVGSSDGLDYHQYALWFWEQLRSGSWSLERLFDLEIRAGELPATFERMATGEAAPVKVFVRYREER